MNCENMCFLDVRAQFRRVSGVRSPITAAELTSIAPAIQRVVAECLCALLGGDAIARVEVNYAATFTGSVGTNDIQFSITRYSVDAAYVLIGVGIPPFSEHDHDDILFLLTTVLPPEFKTAFGSDITLEAIVVDHHHCPVHS